MIIRPTISNYSSCSLSPQQYNTVILNTTTLNASQYTIYSSNNSILISRSMNTSSNIGVTNVKNPSSAISTYSFTISSKNANDSISPSIYNTINYSPGSLQSCQYSFSGTTEQSNSTLSRQTDRQNTQISFGE